MAASEILIRDRVMSVRVMSDVGQTTETRVMAFGKEETNLQEELMEMSGW